MRKLQGTIQSLKMIKTAVVEISRMKQHPIYKKTYVTSKRVKAHVEDSTQFSVGDKVIIEEVRPMSREKRWRIVQKI